MAGSGDTDSFEAVSARKLLRLLDALRQSPAGAVIYRQVERMLREMTETHLGVQQAYAGIANSLLDVYAQHLHPGSPLQVQVKLLAGRLQPPLSLPDLHALRDYIDVYADQISRLDRVQESTLRDAVRPLLAAFGIVEAPLETGTAPAAEPAVGSSAQQPAEPEEKVDPSAAIRDTTADRLESPTMEVEEGREPATLRRETVLDYEPLSPEELGEELVSSSVVQHEIDARRRDIEEIQAGLAHRVLDTISQNQEFGVLLEVVLNEVRQASDVTDLETLRSTLVHEIERLMEGHHELADKLDKTYQYLQMVESDSRQLTDELTRVRLLSLTDELTGLSNRRAFLRRLEDEVARVQRYGFPLSLALIDLDKFKEINDKFGHAAGDEVLRVYAKSILSIFRHHDLVARYGGEEFAVLLPNTDAEGAMRALKKVRQRCAEIRWHLNGQVYSMPTFSAGLALYKPGETSSAFVERVDKALYRAKRMGRDRIELDTTYLAPEKPPAADNGGEKG
ncbi:GGDEF domain-containing protein [Thiohalobacter sp.]|uniref:GGDEF domain-containing protein n=1 Tax=Thiohalobacter sp. TaxID=2025948 RepID=UPI002603A898|nr:GGDEF domain-containing protein [Thiohalobacter sp.]